MNFLFCVLVQSDDVDLDVAYPSQAEEVIEILIANGNENGNGSRIWIWSGNERANDVEEEIVGLIRGG